MKLWIYLSAAHLALTSLLLLCMFFLFRVHENQLTVNQSDAQSMVVLTGMKTEPFRAKVQMTIINPVDTFKSYKVICGDIKGQIVDAFEITLKPHSHRQIQAFFPILFEVQKYNCSIIEETK